MNCVAKLWRRGLRGAATGCALMALLSAPLGAQDAPGAAQGVTPIDVGATTSIDVRATVPPDIRDTPGAASTMTGEDIQELRPYTLHDALDFVPGVRTIDDDPLGRRSGIGIRGAPPRRSRKTLLLEDGTPINASTYLDPGAHYTPPMERLETIDVLRGAGQIVHGPLNNYGVINFRNKRPTSDPETVAELSPGNLGTFRRHLMHRRTDGRLGLVVAYTGGSADGAFDVEEFDYDDFYAGAEWTANARNNAGFSLTYFRERSDYDESNLSPEDFAANPRGKLVLDEAREFNNISVNYWKADLTHNFVATDRLSFSSKLFVTDLDRPRFLTDGTSPLEGGVMQGRDRGYRGYGVETRAEMAGVGANHTFQAGVRWERQLFDDNRPVGRPGEVLDESNRGELFAVDGEDGFTVNGRATRFQASAVSAFFQDVMTFGRWRVIPGIRVEYFNQRMREIFRPGAVLANESSDNSIVLPGVSLLYGQVEDTEIYAGVHRGYAPAIARTIAFPLTPETGINSQVGMRTERVGGVRIDVAVFLNMIRDTLIKEDFTDSFGDNIFINSADSRAAGIDLGVRADSSSYWDSPYNLFAEAAYNFTNARFTEGPLDGKRLPEIPLNAGSLTLGVEHTSGWNAGVTASHLGHFFADRENTLVIDADRGRVPGRTLVSARAGYALPGTPVALWVQGRNLTDKLYISDVSDGLRPGAERTIVAGMTVKF